MRLRFLATATALVLPLAVSPLPAAAFDYAPYVTVDAAPDGAKVTVGEHFHGTEFGNTRPLSQGAVGSLPVFKADDQWGCDWTTATTSLLHGEREHERTRAGCLRGFRPGLLRDQLRNAHRAVHHLSSAYPHGGRGRASARPLRFPQPTRGEVGSEP